MYHGIVHVALNNGPSIRGLYRPDATVGGYLTVFCTPNTKMLAIYKDFVQLPPNSGLSTKGLYTYIREHAIWQTLVQPIIASELCFQVGLFTLHSKVGYLAWRSYTQQSV